MRKNTKPLKPIPTGLHGPGKGIGFIRAAAVRRERKQRQDAPEPLPGLRMKAPQESGPGEKAK